MWAASFYLVCTVPHRLRCEQLFVSAGCSMKEFNITYFPALGCRTACSCASSSGTSSYRSFSSFEKIFAVDQLSKVDTGAGSLFRATTYGTLLISSSAPSTWVLWWRLRPWSHHSLLTWTYHDTLLWAAHGPCSPLSVFSLPLAIPMGCTVRVSVCHHL